MRATHIVDLPPELMAKILGFYFRDLYESDSILFDDTHPMHRVLGLTHVCQVFRMVALHCSELWCNISPQKPEVLRHFLHFSRNRPLHVCLEGSIHYRDGWNYLRSILPAHCKRIQKLELTLPHNHMRVMLSEVWKDLPLLSVCTLQMTSASHDGLLGWAEDAIELDAIPLPSLRSIYMSCAVIIFPWSSCRNLVNLSLSLVSPALPWGEFAQLLQQSPRLESILFRTVEFYGPVEFDFRISLPHLMTLDLYDIQTPIIFALFHVITTISLTKVFIKIHDDTSNDETIRLQEATHLGTLTSTSSNVGLLLYHDNGASSIATIFTEPAHKKKHSVAGSEQLLRAEFDLSLVKNIYLEMNMSEGEPLDGSTFDYIDDDLELTLDRCTSVLELQIMGPISHLRLILEHLSCPAVGEEIQLESGQSLVCPKIQVIEMTLIRDFDTLESFLSSLLECLAVRTKLGMKLATVRLKGRGLRRDISGRFKGLVGQLFIQGRRVEIENS